MGELDHFLLDAPQECPVHQDGSIRPAPKNLEAALLDDGFEFPSATFNLDDDGIRCPIPPEGFEEEMGQVLITKGVGDVLHGGVDIRREGRGIVSQRTGIVYKRHGHNCHRWGHSRDRQAFPAKLRVAHHEGKAGGSPWPHRNVIVHSQGRLRHPSMSKSIRKYAQGTKSIVIKNRRIHLSKDFCLRILDDVETLLNELHELAHDRILAHEAAKSEPTTS